MQQSRVRMNALGFVINFEKEDFATMWERACRIDKTCGQSALI